MEAQAAPDVPNVKPCCKNKANMEVVEIRGEFTQSKCQVCQCRHFRLDAEPGFLGLLGEALGS